MSPYGDSARASGHTGGGPGSSIAVYRFEQTYPARTVAVFGTVEDEAVVEAEALRRGESQPTKRKTPARGPAFRIKPARST